MVELSGPNSRVWKVQMFLVTLPKLYSPLSGLTARKPHVQEVIRRIRQGPHSTRMSLPLKV